MSKPSRIEPRTLKGFRDFLPAPMMARERLIEIARRVYRSYGYAPIDTPALEYLEILQGKGGDESDKQLYQFRDHGDRAVGMRFDLTVPLARFAAQHVGPHEGKLPTPFKRYHIATVWRGENTQRGRYREFMQCDFDIIGTKSIAADVETVLVVHDLFTALGFDRFTIRVNNRRLLTGLLETLDLADRATVILRALDKLAKAGRNAVAAELVDVAACTQQQTERVLGLVELTGASDEVLAELEPRVADSETAQQGITELRQLFAAVTAAGVSSQRVALDVSIARGLDYYTGTIIETFLDDLPTIGSVCSGGRYDNLAELYTKQELPGIGASLGLDRLLAAMEELGMTADVATPAPVFVPQFTAARLGDYLRLAATLRQAGIGVDVSTEAKKLGAQMKYADRRGFRFALILGEDEFTQGVCKIRDLASGDEHSAPLDDDYQAVVAHLLEQLGPPTA